MSGESSVALAVELEVAPGALVAWGPGGLRWWRWSWGLVPARHGRDGARPVASLQLVAAVTKIMIIT